MARKRRWGEGQIVPLPNGRARVRWRENGARRSKNFASRSLAEAFLKGRVGDIARGEAGLGPDPRRLPVLDVLAKEWIARREFTHRSWKDDRGRWTLHLAPHFGRVKAHEVDTAMIRRFIEEKTRQRMNKDSLRLCVATASSLFTDLCERPRETGVERNPFRGLPRDLRKLLKSDYDPRFAPYVERLSEVRALFQAMPEPAKVAYALGVVAGLRPGEILALSWPQVRHGERIDVRWQVQNGRLGPLKDNEARILQGAFLAPLWPVLAAWRLQTGGEGLLFPPSLCAVPGRRSGEFIHPKRLKEGLEVAVKRARYDMSGWPERRWYYATRHTMATHWLRAGHPLGELALVLGHSATFVTERYAHIRPGAERDDPWQLDLGADGARVVEIGPRMAPGSRHRKRKS